MKNEIKVFFFKRCIWFLCLYRKKTILFNNCSFFSSKKTPTPSFLVVVFLAGCGKGTEVVSEHGAKEIMECLVGRRNLGVGERKGNLHMCALLVEMCCMFLVYVLALCCTCVFHFLG